MRLSRILRSSVPKRPLAARICVLLAFLILYNPFAALTNSGNTFAVRGLERHRATVGVSELQHLAGCPDQTQQNDVNLRENREELAGPVADYQPQRFERDVELPQPESASRLWSRPPPLV